MKLVNAQTGLSYAIVSNLMADSITVKVQNVPVEEALEKAFTGHRISFRIEEGAIIVFNQPASRPVFRLKGVVYDSIAGEPVAGVAVLLQDGSGKAVITRANGRFVIEGAPLKGRVMVKHMSYEQDTVNYDRAADLIIQLVPKINLLSDVVSMGYFQTVRELNTGSVSVTKGELMGKHPVNDPLKALPGVMSGVFVKQLSGVPGAGVHMLIRGQNSIANGNDPLYLIDGVPVPLLLTQAATAANTFGLLVYLRPDDIESIEVLKDADATAIYGSRGANGVVLITTKKRKAGKAQLIVNVYQGVGKCIRRLDLMNSEQYLQLRQRALASDGKQASGRDHDINGNWGNPHRYTDWQKELIGNTSQLTDVGMALSGGSEQVQFRLAGSYMKETTVFPGQFYNRRFTGGIGVTYRSANEKVTVAADVNYGKDSVVLPQSDLTRSIWMAPNAPDVYDEKGNLNWKDTTWLNPLAALLQTSRTFIKSTRRTLSLDYRLFKDMYVKLFYGYHSGSIGEQAITPYNSLLPSTPDADNYRINITASNGVRL